MRDIKDLEKMFDNISKNIVKDLAKVQEETAQKICEDAKSLAPGTGMYRSSIKVSKPEISKDNINIRVYSDITVTAKSNGNTYNLGFLLETGTEMHAIPNAFGWGDIFGYDSDMYKRTLRKDWHPGFASIPHFEPALNKNKKVFENNIKKVLDKEFK